MSAASEAVTVGGWYENSDGTVTDYQWRNGVVHAIRTVASWADVPTQEQEAKSDAADWAEFMAWQQGLVRS